MLVWYVDQKNHGKQWYLSHSYNGYLVWNVEFEFHEKLISNNAYIVF